MLRSCDLARLASTRPLITDGERLLVLGTALVAISATVSSVSLELPVPGLNLRLLSSFSISDHKKSVHFVWIWECPSCLIIEQAKSTTKKKHFGARKDCANVAERVLALSEQVPGGIAQNAGPFTNEFAH